MDRGVSTSAPASLDQVGLKGLGFQARFPAVEVLRSPSPTLPLDARAGHAPDPQHPRSRVNC